MVSRTITIQASAREEAVPDLAQVEVKLVAPAEAAVDAQTRLRDRAATLRESVTTVSPDQIRTVNRRIEETSEVFEPATDAPVQATEHFHIDCLPETAADVIVEVADAGASVTDIQFHLHDDVRQDLQNDALRAAMTRARDKAEQMAAAEGLTVGNVQQAAIQDTGMESIVDEALAMAPDKELQPDPIGVTQEVEVTYALDS
jgi:uncharacterized protein YggE